MQTEAISFGFSGQRPSERVGSESSREQETEERRFKKFLLIFDCFFLCVHARVCMCVCACVYVCSSVCVRLSGQAAARVGSESIREQETEERR